MTMDAQECSIAVTQNGVNRNALTFCPTPTITDACATSKSRPGSPTWTPPARLPKPLPPSGWAQHQIDTYFHCLHGRLKLRQIDGLRGELICYARADEQGPKSSDYQLAPIAHPETLKAALTAALGVRAVVEKRREIFLHHNVRIHLDEVVNLGCFLEFEAVLGPKSDETAGRALIEDLTRRFAISPADLLSGSYGEMVR